MKIRMKIDISGSRNGEPWPPKGEIADVPTGEAQHLVASGIAEEVDQDDAEADQDDAEAGALETATAPEAETPAATPAKRSRAPKAAADPKE